MLIFSPRCYKILKFTMALFASTYENLVALKGLKKKLVIFGSHHIYCSKAYGYTSLSPGYTIKTTNT
jgi:hypothetical protein